jgi:hypothetical protein
MGHCAPIPWRPRHSLACLLSAPRRGARGWALYVRKRLQKKASFSVSRWSFRSGIRQAIPQLNGWTQCREELLREEGTLSILRRGTIYQVRYASNNPYAPDRQPQACPDGATLDALLQHLGTEAGTITQAWTTLQHGGIAVFCILLSPAQMQACFPPLTALETSRETDAPAPR